VGEDQEQPCHAQHRRRHSDGRRAAAARGTGRDRQDFQHALQALDAEAEGQAARETLATIEALLGKLNFSSMGMAFIDSVAAREELEALAVKLRAQIEKLDAEGSSSRGNALMDERNEYLVELRHVWDTAIVPAAARHRRKDLIRFLLACASPLFPKTTDKAIENYLDRRPQTRA
jgi:hypothetical protein